MQALTEQQLLRFLAACRDANEIDWLMALLAYHHGLRVSELTGRWAVKRVKGQKVAYFHHGIRASDVEDGRLTVVRLKGSKRTCQPLVTHSNPLLNEREALIRLASRKLPNQPLFKFDRTTVWRRLQRHGRKAGIRLSSAHIRGIKHTLGTIAAEKVPVKVLQIQMGHVNPKSTLAYYDVTPERAAETVAEALGGEVINNI